MFYNVAGRVPCTRTERGARRCARVKTGRTATAWTAPAPAVRAGWAPAAPSHANRANMEETAGQLGVS
jgi:hypothetical protein